MLRMVVEYFLKVVASALVAPADLGLAHHGGHVGGVVYCRIRLLADLLVGEPRVELSCLRARRRNVAQAVVGADVTRGSIVMRHDRLAMCSRPYASKVLVELANTIVGAVERIKRRRRQGHNRRQDW